MKKIILAGGCFWGLQHFLKTLPGIIKTEVGYANSRIVYPTYQQVCSGATNATEAVEVVYDPAAITLAQLLDAYFHVIDPTSVNRQGNDMGTNYRTGIYWTDEGQVPVIERTLAYWKKVYGRLAVESGKLVNFFPAEDYHQDYLVKNPEGYCHISPAKMRSYRLPDVSELAERGIE